MNEKFTQGTWCPDFETGNIYPVGVEYAIAGAYSSPVSPEEYEANLRLLAHAKDLYFALELARPFVPEDISIRESVDKVLRGINPDFDKPNDVTDIKQFAQRVKNMRDWQKERANNPNTNTEYYAAGNEQLVDSIVAEILQEEQS